MTRSVRYISLFFALILILSNFLYIGMIDSYAAVSFNGLGNALDNGTNTANTININNFDGRYGEISGYDKIRQNTDIYLDHVKEAMSNANKRGEAKDIKFLDNAMANFNEHAQYIYGLLTAFGAITSLLMFIIIFVRITWLPEHAFQKRQAMEDMVTSGIATILLGGAWLIISLFYSVFSRMWDIGIVYSKDWKTAGGIFLVEYKGIVVGFLGVATLTALLMMIKSITGVVLAGTNPQQKAAKMSQVIWCGIATAGLGSLTIFTSLFWNVLRF